MDFLGVRGLPGGLLLGGLAGEEIGQAIESDLAPAIELVGMNAVLRGQLAGRALLTQHLLDELGLEFRCVVSLLAHGRISTLNAWFLGSELALTSR